VAVSSRFAGTDTLATSPTQRALWSLAAALHLGLALWVFHACLQPGLFPYGRDTVFHDILFFDHGWSTVRETGLIPLWNHHLFAGWPWVAAAGWTPWYPLHWIALFAPIAFAFTMQYALHHAWAGLGFTLWGRALDLGFGPALLGGVLFQMSGHFTTLVFPGHLSKFEAIAWMPWVMALFLMTLNRRSGRLALLAAVCLAMQILTQHAQIVYYTVGLLVALALWRAFLGSRVERQGWMAPDEPAFAQRSLRPLRYLIGVGLLAGALALVQLLPAMEMIRISNRAEGVSWEEAVQTSYPPRELTELVWPGLFGSSVDGTYRGAWGERLVSDYLGMVTVLGALFITVSALLGTFFTTVSPGFRSSLSPWLFRPVTRTLALISLLILTLLLALGDHTPLYRLLYDWLPGWDRWRSPATIMCVSTFAACTLAAMGWGGVLSRERRSLGVGMVAVLIALAVVDQARVVRRHVEPVSLYEMRRFISGQYSPISFSQEIKWRHYIHTQELSNAPLARRSAFLITGYHPITLNTHQLLFETLGYNNPQLHRLLGVNSWLTPRERPLDPPFELITDYREIPVRSARYLFYRSAEAGQGMWTPGTVTRAETREQALTELSDAVEANMTFEQVAIVGIDPAETASGLPTRLGSDMLLNFADFRDVWNQNPPPNNRPMSREMLICYSMPTSNGLIPNPDSLLVAAGSFPQEPRWLIISMLLAPGWKLWGVTDPHFDYQRAYHTHLSIPSSSRRLKIHPAWGVLWGVQIQGDEAFLYAEYRPASVRLGLFVTLAALAVVLALGGRLPKTDPQP
jgi:hypothetical protein